MKMCAKGLHDLDEPGVAKPYAIIGGGGVKREFRYCGPCRTVAANTASRRRLAAMKDRVIEMYGGRCACCGISRRIFLALDHINGGGKAERTARSDGPYRNALKVFRPDVYRVLCHNCNMAMHFEENHTCSPQGEAS